MAFREIRIVGDPVLRTPCAPITQITPGVRTLVEDLLENVDEDGRAGLAANQIGVSLRAFSWNIEGEIGYIQHEVDHLDGHLYVDRLERDVRKQAMRAIRDL